MSFIFLFVVFAGSTLFAQFNAGYSFKFKTYTTKDGLVHNYTKKCLTDSKGFLWIITQHGLSRFDGLNFRNFEHVYGDTTSLPENDLEDIAIDNSDNIWLGYKTGLCYYDQSARTFKIVRPDNQAFPCFSVLFDQKRNCIWSINYTGYTQINSKTLSARTYVYQKPITTRLGIESCYRDSHDRLWIPLDRRGYYTIQLATNQQYYYDQDIWPMQVYEDRENQIWMTTWSSGFRKITITGPTHQHTLFKDPFVSKYDPFGEINYGIAESDPLTGKDVLWITNSTNGLLFFDKKEGKFTREFLYDASIKNGIATEFNNTIYTDPNGIVWICTWHGLTKVNKQEQQFNSRELPFLKTRDYNRLSGIQDDPYNNNILWLGIEGSGLMKFNKLTNTPLERYFFLEGEETPAQEDFNYNWRWVESMFTDSKKNIWATAYGGLIKIANGVVKKNVLSFNNELVYPKNMIEYPVGTLWLATTKGLFSVDIATGANKPFQQSVTSKNNPSPDNRLIDVIRNDSSHLLVAGTSGAYQFDISSGHFKKLVWHFPGLDSIGQQECYCIQQINQDAYIGTSAGLVVYNLQTDESFVIGSNEGITKVYHSRLKKDAKNNLWVFTSHGLFKYDPHDKSFQEYTTGDGIYDFSEDRIGFFEYDKQFYIGYRMAMTSFDPLAVNVNQAKTSPVITDIYINNKILTENIDSFATRTLTLAYRQNDITFNFTGADFTNSDKITFAHQLVGYDKDWVYSGTSRTAIYTNLKGGVYTFKVKARNSSGLWNEKEQVVKIKIATPFWQTIWFYLLVALFVCLVAWTIYRYRINQLIELYKVRDTISKNLHDEIGATLSSIHIYSDVARKKGGTEKETHTLMDRIYKASGEVMESMNDIVWYVNPKNDTWDNIMVHMREYAIPLLEAKDIIPDFVMDESLLKHKLTMLQRQHIYFIFKEAINNIVKYSEAKKVTIRLEQDKNLMTLIIGDDGKGFDKKIVRTGNGLTNMQQRAATLHGQLLVSSAPGEGTKIHLELGIT